MTRKFQEVIQSQLLSAELTQIGEAYQVLSDSTLRAKYDKFGVDAAKPTSGFGKNRLYCYLAFF